MASIDLLKKANLFESLSNDQRKAIIEVGKEENFKAG